MYIIFILTLLFIAAPIFTFLCHIWKRNFCKSCKEIVLKQKKLRLCVDKFLFTDFSKGKSKKNAIVFFIIVIISLLTYFLNIYNTFLSEILFNNNSLKSFLDILEQHYNLLLIPLDLLIFISYISAFLINKFVEKIFPLEDGIDLNSNEHNTIIRFGTFCELIKNLNTEKIKPTAYKIGKEFGARLEIQYLDLTNKKDLIILEEKWNKTDSELARFYKKVIIKQLSSTEIQLEIVEPFWSQKFHSNCNINLKDYPLQKYKKPTRRLHCLCAFNYHYVEGILSQAKHVTENSFSIKCLEDNKCYLNTLDNKCYFKIYIKKNNDNND